MGRPEPSLVVLERGTDWQRRLRPELSSVKLWACSELRELAEGTITCPSAPWLLVCREDNLEPILAETWRATTQRATTVVVALAPALRCHARWFRQAGAAWVQTDWRDWRPVVHVLRRYWNRSQPSGQPLPELIWDRLAWPEMQQPNRRE